MVDNRDELTCNSEFRKVPVSLGHHLLNIDICILPFKGAQVVMEIQWLQSLGPILMDYSTLSMEFKWKGQEVLYGIIEGNMEAVSS